MGISENIKLRLQEKRNKWRWLFICLAVSCALTFLQDEGTPVRAAVARMTIKASSEDVKVGDTFYIMVTIIADEEMKGFDGYLTYDQSYMKYVTGGSVSSGNDDEIHIHDTDRDQGAVRIKYSIKCEARRAGVCEIALKKPYKVYSMDDSALMSVGASSLNLRIASPPQKKKKKQKGKKTSDTVQDGEGKLPGVPGAGPEGGLSGISETEPEGGMPEVPEDDWEEFSGSGPERERELPAAPDDSSQSQNSQTELSDTGSEGEIQPTNTDGFSVSPLPESMEGSSGGFTGLDKKTCIIIICMASMGLLLIVIMFSSIFHAGREGLPEEENPVEGWFSEDSLADSPDTVEAGEKDEGMEWESWEEKSMGNEGLEESLEDINERLEIKRRWLRKDRR